MYRDQKIGLSLAVLLIGFATAFCFRNEPLNEPHPLALEQAVELDSRIEQLPVRAYTQREGVGGILREPDRLEATTKIVDVAFVDQPVDLMPFDDVQTGDQIELFAGPPEPMSLNQHVETSTAQGFTEKELSTTYVLPQSLPADENSDRTGQVPDSGSVPPTPEAFAASPLREYTVRSGDTLSGVSLQMFGTSSRYLEIYQANRGVLADPDDLPVGTTLRIP